MPPIRPFEPAALAATASTRSPEDAADPARALLEAAGPLRGRVLLVEDNEDNQIVYATILRHVGHTVFIAGDGQTAIVTAQRDRPDVILMDISLPVLDGWEATRVLKEAEATRDIPIVALTAHALASDRARALACGCDAYLTKPVDPRDVLTLVGRLLMTHADLTPPSDAPEATPPSAPVDQG